MPPTLNLEEHPRNPRERPGYDLVFDDDFDGPDLNTDHWLPHYLPQWSSRAQSAAHYRIAGSLLILSIDQNQAAWCPEFDDGVRASALQSGVFAGPLGSRAGQSRFNDRLVVREAQPNALNYAQKFGYIETRVKGGDAGGTHASLWMIGYEDIPEHSGEICLFELLGNEAGATSSAIRFGVHPWSDPSLREEFYTQILDIDTRNFHVYGVEWTPARLTFFVDNRPIRSIDQSPQYPLQFMLGIFELPFVGGWNGPFNAQAPYPKDFVIDYVRGYRWIGE